MHCVFAWHRDADCVCYLQWYSYQLYYATIRM